MNQLDISKHDSSTSYVLLRDVTLADLPTFFEHQLDPTANYMAAFTAKDNIASLRVLDKCGFKFSGTDRGYSNARGEQVEEYVLKLDL